MVASGFWVVLEEKEVEKGSARIVWWLTKIKPRTSEGVLKSETWHWLWWAVSVFLQWQGCRVRIQRQCCAIPQPHLAEAHTSETDVGREHRLADKPRAPPLCSELAFGCTHPSAVVWVPAPSRQGATGCLGRNSLLTPLASVAGYLPA